MRTLRKKMRCAATLVLAALWLMCITAAADSGDNSLYSLGLENASSCTPEFYYSTLEYEVVVPAGTKELLLTPVTSNSEAKVVDISGAELAEDGTGTVYVTVEAPNGAQVSYTLHVTSEAPQETEAPQTEASQEQQQQEEQQRQAQSEAMAQMNSELEAARNQAQSLLVQNNDLTERINLLMKVMYGLVGFAALLLFFIINQTLRNKDLKDDLKEARSQTETGNEFTRKEQAMPNGYYYNTPQNLQQNPQQTEPPLDASRNVQAAFGNAPQTLRARAADDVTSPASFGDEDVRAAKQPQQAKAEPDLVKGEMQEPDVDVEMIDL